MGHGGAESGLTDPAEAERVPPFFFAKQGADGRKVWAHWVWCKYGVDFRKQDGQWRIWRFRCFEVARAPYDENWIAFAAHERATYEAKLMYFGDDGAGLPAARGRAHRHAVPAVPDRHRPAAGTRTAATLRAVRGHLPLS